MTAPDTTPEFGSLPQYPIESVDNALRVLLHFREEPIQRLTDVSRYLDVASSTAHRLLAMLQYRGFVRQDTATRGYVPGPSLDALAIDLLRRMDVRAVARPIVETLSAELQETVHLGWLEGADVRFILSVESTRALRVGGRLGRSMPAHCTSTGKALLAQLSDDEFHRLYPQEELSQMTANSIGTRTDLVRALTEIRSRGYATSAEESEEGVGSLAAALPSARAPQLALNVSMPISRMNDESRTTVRVAVLAAAAELDQLLA